VGVTTVAVLVRSVVMGLRGRSPGRGFYGSLVYVACWVGLAGVTWLALLSTEPQMQADRLLMLASSASANSGLVHDPVSVVGKGLMVLSAAMVLGRVLSLSYLWWLAGECEAQGRGLFEQAGGRD
jgi:Trk-type K+ transport system membrane component